MGFGGETGNGHDRVVPFRMSGWAATGRRDGSETTTRATAELRAYWEALRAGRPAPFRSEIDPRGIERALEYTFILERMAPRVARLRLAGSHLNTVMGMETRGLPLTSFFMPEARDQISDTVEAVFDGPATADLRLAAPAAAGRPALVAELTLLPLTDDSGVICRMLGCLVIDGPLGRAPRRFTIAAGHIAPILATVPRRPPMPQGAAVPGGFAEPRAGFGPARAGHLRVVVSND
ncbi:MAG: PAS domain-containing protein [Defluviimonas sp.]|uniref:PAS domain-containing protein n=1 Tax=Albidovulum sp. TaxID=1872424 RepID=UPI001D2B556A|nr:PAS domain-containing protein [Paracoccaceae bacterium]MCC0064099.1 PAS domain-containing protein [Defluviimonas sp.]